MYRHNTEGPRIARILGLQKNTLREIRVSGTVGGPLLTQKSPTYKAKTTEVGDRVSDFRVGDPLYYCSCNLSFCQNNSADLNEYSSYCGIGLLWQLHESFGFIVKLF